MTLASVEQMVGMAPAVQQTAVLPAVRQRPEMPGVRKAAVFIAQLSKEDAGALMAKMRPREVELVTRELMKIGSVEPDDVAGVLEEFHDLMTAQRFVGRGGGDVYRQSLAAGLRGDKTPGPL